MNIIKRIANWIIKKLGGYTEEELKKAYNDGVTGSDKTHEDTIERMRYWFNKYYEEHTAYLALLNCHNAAAAAKTDALTMARGIKARCIAIDDCAECRLAGENGKCNVNEIPCYWEVEVT